jgi:hypothetical protein
MHEQNTARIFTSAGVSTEGFHTPTVVIPQSFRLFQLLVYVFDITYLWLILTVIPSDFGTFLGGKCHIQFFFPKLKCIHERLTPYIQVFDPLSQHIF